MDDDTTKIGPEGSDPQKITSAPIKIAAPAAPAPPAPAPPPQQTIVPPATTTPRSTPPAARANPLRSAAPSVELESEVPIIAKESDTQNADVRKQDIQQVLKSIKLPEKRTAIPKEKKAAPPEPKVYDTTLAGSSASNPPAAASPPVPQTPTPRVSPPPPSAPQTDADKKDDKKDGKPIVSVHTLKDDLEHAVSSQNLSLVRAAALEEDRRQRQEREAKAKAAAPMKIAPRKSHKGLILSLVSVLFIGLVAAGAYSIWQVRSSAPELPQNASLIFAEKKLTFALRNRSGADIKQSISQMRDPGAPLGSVVEIMPTVQEQSGSLDPRERPATLSEFLTSIEARVPEELLRALKKEFFFGFHSVETSAPVIIIPVVAFERAFAGMLEWEGEMSQDLSPIFPYVPPTVVDQEGLLADRKFEDGIIRNYDARILYQDSGEIGLIYSFPTRNLLIIAESPASFTEVLSRLRANRQLQ